MSDSGRPPWLGEDETLDLLLDDRVALIQARRGYRTSVDSLLLAAVAAEVAEGDTALWARLCDGAAALDLGAGSGLVSLLLGMRLRARGAANVSLRLLELQPQLAARAERNLALNGLAAGSEVVCADLADPVLTLPTAALVVCNPPYFRAAGRMAPRTAEKTLAHYENSASLERFCEVAATALQSDGCALFVYPFEGHTRLLAALLAAGLGDRQLRTYCHLPAAPTPRRVVVIARPGPAALVRAPLQALMDRDPPDSLYANFLVDFLDALPRGAAEWGLPCPSPGRMLPCR